MDMKKEIKAQYIGPSTVELATGFIYYLNLSKDEPNAVEVRGTGLYIIYDSVYGFFNSWKLN